VSGRETRLDRLETAFPAPGSKARLCQNCGGLALEDLFRALDVSDQAADASVEGATIRCNRCGGEDALWPLWEREKAVNRHPLRGGGGAAGPSSGSLAGSYVHAERRVPALAGIQPIPERHTTWRRARRCMLPSRGNRRWPAFGRLCVP
jgi:hypothetical protein